MPAFSLPAAPRRLTHPLHAAGTLSYRVQGPLSKPRVRLNPLAALTPGFLRNLFGIFGGPETGNNQKPNAPESKPATGPSPSPNPNPPSGPPR